MSRAVVALGSNLGDRLTYLRGAVAGLRRLGTVISTSSLYETEPVGGPDQGRYLNAAVVIDTELSPRTLLEELLAIEKRADRVRQVRWGPRTLDLDIITHGDSEVADPDLTVPHPHAHARAFVLAPVAEIAPNARLANGQTAMEALHSVDRSGIFKWSGYWLDGPPRLGWISPAFVGVQFVLFLAFSAIAVFTGDFAPTPLRYGVGLVFAGAGGWLVVGALMKLGVNLSALPDPRPGGSLAESGVFGVVRHPIYGGLVLGGVGAAIILGTWWPVPVLGALVGLFWFKSGYEERALTLVYPDYPAYAERVRRRFIPFVL